MRIVSTTLSMLLMSVCAIAQNYVSTYAGTGANSYADGDTASCAFKGPFGMCLDHSGNLYIADNNDHRIRKISVGGLVTTVAGTGTAGYLDGPDSIAQFNAPSDLCVDAQGNIYVSDFQNQRIRKISVNGTVSTIAGEGTAGYLDGPVSVARFNYPRGICIDETGNLYVADSWNHRIRKIDTSGNVSTLAGYSDTIGVQSPGDYADGMDTSARFNVPCGMSIDSIGNLYLADAYNHRIRKITPTGIVTTIAGSGNIGANNGGFLDGDVSMALLNTPTEVFIDENEKIFIGDTYNQRIRQLENGTISTVAGNGTPGLQNGADSLAEFKNPRGLVEDESGNRLFVCDYSNHVIRKISLNINTGIDMDRNDYVLPVFPNPAAERIFFNAAYIFENFCVTDILGHILLSGKLQCGSATCSISVEFLTDGIYTLRLASKGAQIASGNFIISH